MKITILTLFPNQFEGFLNTSIIKRSIDSGIVEVEVINFRDYSTEIHHKVDYPPVGGGAGMILALQPIVDCLKDVRKENSKVYLLSAQGQKYEQKMAKELAKNEHIILICGHYEGIDARIENYIDGEISIGDYILTGGEVPAMVVADSIIRLLDGSINKESTKEESFEQSLLEYDQYTLPKDFEGHTIPEVLLTGNHKVIKEYRFKNAVKKTQKRRPDLYEKCNFNKQEMKLIADLEDDSKEQEAILKAKKQTNKN